ncbi:MAG: hypothetical protein A2W31_16775 [Planctomycetes bacterium RBG_16_64_10]|nr:MAG: hypothetical protein A2W31_16775 [Planctomycetes bacterium RBG_16_64_10]
MPIVRLPRHLIHQIAAPSECRAAGVTVAEVLADLERQFPGVRDYVVDDRGVMRQYVNIFIGQQWVQDRIGLSDPVAETDEIMVMQALSGG